MNLPVGFSTAADAIPLYPLTGARLPAFLGEQPEPIRAWVSAHAFSAAPGAVLALPTGEGRVAAVLAGVTEGDDPWALAHLPELLPEGDYRLCGIDANDALLLGWGLGSYRFERYRKRARPPARLLLDAALQEGAWTQVLAACLRVRDLVNTPTEHMGPADLEALLRQLAQRYAAQFRSVVGDALLGENLPAIHAVGRASHREPRLLELTWGDPVLPRLAIVGKGVCFDTGGLDLKPADGMRNMKKDMGGGAHAIALAEWVMASGLPVHLRLYVPAVENAIAANAYRPGEVIATRKGLSVEIDNTDAEGRLVLCDALTLACEHKPDILLDFATLTGAARIALGPDLPVLFANDDGLADAWLKAGRAQSDPLWRLPLWQPYHRYLKSGIADLANSGASRMAGAITAALYLQRFVPDAQPWAHLDVYSWNDADQPGRPAGGEAQGLRAAIAMLEARYRR